MKLIKGQIQECSTEKLKLQKLREDFKTRQDKLRIEERKLTQLKNTLRSRELALAEKILTAFNCKPEYVMLDHYDLALSLLTAHEYTQGKL